MTDGLVYEPVVDYQGCLLVSCPSLVPMLEKTLGFKCDESFLEESAIANVADSVRLNTPYRFVFIDLDEPSLLLGRFMKNLNAVLREAGF